MQAHANVSLRVAVAGGSIGGLCAGIALRAIGCDVNIFERTAGPMTSRGAGIVVQPDLLMLMQSHGAPRLPMTTCSYRQYLEPDGGSRLMPAPQQFTSWDAIYMTLRAAFPVDRYIQGVRLTGFDQSDDTVTLTFDGHAATIAGLLVCRRRRSLRVSRPLDNAAALPALRGLFRLAGHTGRGRCPCRSRAVLCRPLQLLRRPVGRSRSGVFHSREERLDHAWPSADQLGLVRPCSGRPGTGSPVDRQRRSAPAGLGAAG